MATECILRKMARLDGVHYTNQEVARFTVSGGPGGVTNSQAWGCGYHGVPVTEVHHTVSLHLRNVKYFILKNGEKKLIASGTSILRHAEMFQDQCLTVFPHPRQSQDTQHA